MSKTAFSNLSFLEIANLPLEESIKDELRIAILHGIDITMYLKKKDLTSEELREYRLSIQSGVSMGYLNTSISSDTLRKIRKLTEKAYDISFLENYLPLNGRPTISEKSLNLILDYANKIDVSILDFNNIKEQLVEPVLNALEKEVSFEYLEPLAYTSEILSEDVVSFLISLAFLKINIKPYLVGTWNKDQILEVVKGNYAYPSTKLIVNNYVSDLFSPNQIREVIRALQFNPSLAKIVCEVDEDNYPIYNEYQMFEIVEGIRFNLEIKKYASPELTDFEMHAIREKLIEDKEKKGQSIRSKLRVNKSTTTIDIQS